MLRATRKIKRKHRGPEELQELQVVLVLMLLVLVQPMMCGHAE
jgi:hypothetical protein